MNYKKIEQIDDHFAYICDCGSVHFNLLKSGKLECANCMKRFGAWMVNKRTEVKKKK